MKALLSFLLAASFSLTKCGNPTKPPKDPVPEHQTFTLASQQLGETRTLNVWTPPGYANEALPVIYMPDGGIQEDFPHVANTLAQLVARQQIQPLRLVGIENIQRRKDLTSFTEIAKDKEVAPVVGGSEKFRAFIRQELFPEIEKRYKTTRERSLIGESLAGLFVMETFLLEPNLFDHYIAFDPSLWWNNHYLVRTAAEQLAQLPETPKTLWFAASGTTDIAPHCQALAQILKTQNRPSLRWQFADEPKEKHNTIFRATKEKALLWTLGKP